MRLKQRDLMVAMQETMRDVGKRLDLSKAYAMNYDTPRMRQPVRLLPLVAGAVLVVSGLAFA